MNLGLLGVDLSIDLHAHYNFVSPWYMSSYNRIPSGVAYSAGGSLIAVSVGLASESQAHLFALEKAELEGMDLLDS